MRERGHWGNPGVEVRIILSCIFMSMDWIELAQDRAPGGHL